jgi:hypothetical protein
VSPSVAVKSVAVSVPLPPLKRSAPDPPVSRSLPLPPLRLSSPAPPDRVSLPLIVAPTAQEIADQLPGSWSVMNSKVTSNYHAAYHGSGDRVNADADTMAEALALLWLELNKAEN